MRIDTISPAKPVQTARPAHGKEMSARIGIWLLFIVLAGCISLVGWHGVTRV